MTDSHPIVIEFFHDCLSAWCYKASERLRAFAAEHPDVQMVQRCYPLAVSPMLFNRQLYTDKREAKRDVVMVHWADARAFEPDPRIDCELMMTRDFDYPYSLPNQLGAKAAEMQGGQRAHWDFFDRVQRAHLTESRNIADYDVLRECAEDIGLDGERWQHDVFGEHARSLLADDIERAARYGILRIPALVADGRHVLGGIPRSTLGHCLREEGIETFYEDIKRRRMLGYGLPPAE